MFKKYLIIFALSFSLVWLGLLPILASSVAPASAATGIGELKENLGGFAENTGLGAKGDADLKGKVANIINIILGFLGVIAVIMIIIAGFKWMMAGGNEETVKQARGNIMNAVIGLLIVFSSYIIINFAVKYLSQATGAGSTSTSGSGTSGVEGTGGQGTQ